jgi:tRNA G10  N-methylase Trm11
MVALGGHSRGRLLDPCCGSGSLLAESSLIGWTTVGGDIADDAIAAAAANATSQVLRLDSRQLPFRDDEFDAVVTNLPFGYQYQVQGAPVAWYRRTLGEAIRVAPRVVVLSPASTPFRQALGRMKVTLVERHDIEILGRPSSIWVLDRGTKA